MMGIWRFDLGAAQWQAAGMVKRFLLFLFLATPCFGAPLSVTTLDGRTLTFEVEIADTAEKQRVGLMHVKNLPPQTGMVFPMQPPRIAQFWMRNTLVPLDMIFILPGGLIGQIVTRRDTQSDRVSVSQQPVSAVLEINAGEAQKLKIGVGDIIKLDGVRF